MLALTYENFAAVGVGLSSSKTHNARDESRSLSRKVHTILVVEDVDEISANMTAALKGRGHRVELASNAEQAIHMAEENRPAMILTDLDLPTFDNLMNRLRAHADLKNMVVAIIDINGPEIADQTVNILCDFQALDDLIESSKSNSLGFRAPSYRRTE